MRNFEAIGPGEARAGALAWVNGVRGRRGMSELDDLPAGEHTWNGCPMALALTGDDYTCTAATWSISLIAKEVTESGDAIVVNFDPPAHARRFIELFDRGAYPELVSSKP